MKDLIPHGLMWPTQAHCVVQFRGEFAFATPFVWNF